MTTAPYVVWFSDVDRHDIPTVGGKGANLGEMTKAGIPVPDGFIVTAGAYFHFIESNNLKSTIHKMLDGLDVANGAQLEKASRNVKDLIVHAPMPKDISQSILNAYLKMGKLFTSDPYVAVRSSATAEDLPDASFAGQQETFLNIKGEASVVHFVRKAWASLFTPRAIFYRVEKKFDHFKVGIAVPVQKMVQSDVSGIMFTLDPVTSDKTKIMIEAIYGLGELIVQGSVTPDHFEVDKKSDKIVAKSIATQTIALKLDGTKTREVKIPKDLQERQKITDSQVLKIAALGRALEKHYYFPQDVEWAIENGKIFITQTRPVTTIAKGLQSSVATQQALDSKKTKDLKLSVLVTGDPASPGIGCGPAKRVLSAKEIKKVMPGDVLVAPQTNPDYVPAMRKVAAIVTERGGRTSHAAIVSRELGIPAVVGAKGALDKITEKLVITVDGAGGKVYKGGVQESVQRQASSVQDNKNLPPTTHNSQPVKTATKVYVNLAESSRVEEVSKRNVNGVGLLRAEFMIADIGVHPKKLIHDHKQSVFINSLAEKLEVFCKAFAPRPVVYRATDFKTNEYRNLRGGKQFEPEEANPMMGYRGAYRYVSDSRVFELELEAIKKVRNKMGYTNLWLMIPYVHTPAEMLEVKKIAASQGLRRSNSFKLWMMVEIPSNVILIDEFLDVGIDGVSIGSNDLTQLTLGIDRDNSEVAQVFDERNPALTWSFERVIKACHKHGVTASICGQAPSDYPEMVEKLVQFGITSISVNPDVVDSVRETIAQAEKKLLRK